MLEVLKKSFDKIDALIILAAVFLFSHFDYDNLSTFDKFYMGSFVLWGLMKFIRVYIVLKDDGDKKEG